MREILIFLESCPTEFKSDVASNIVSIAAKYAPNAQWHIDTILKVNICLRVPPSANFDSKIYGSWPKQR